MAVIDDRRPAEDSQQRVLADILGRTGRWYPKIEAIDTSDSMVAQSVLPVIADWVHIVQEEKVRAAMYTRFHTKHAHAYVSQMLQWAKEEQGLMGRNVLIQAITKAVRPEHGERTWDGIKQASVSEFDIMLMVKLSNLPGRWDTGMSILKPNGKTWVAPEP